ncbi:hypothetical protein HIV01_013610 [Lysobacter arenosi]|uniref:Uncharacterized protein n=1 Tax=Lysobacter arenosi TaxID=2795387 RepID=A0ABX7R7X5_9GAMM|nr:DUF6527 family protein [Lysobacter arenosi]QSX74225.1 hypothetical protein HIV01_013610 [Lysobacter arenosi]
MSTIRPELVEFIPQSLATGVLYISERYRTASHLCACGCGEKVVTPLSPSNWRLVRQGDRVSLYPSIGNWNYACRSHYWIKNNKIVWSGQMAAARIAQVQERDRLDKAREIEQRNRAKLTGKNAAKPLSLWTHLGAVIKRLLD